VHRHGLNERVDGAHTHTPQNPGGEHVHGEFAGTALIDGSHHHNEYSEGWHHHKDEDDNKGTIVPQNPSQT
jgi:hypothetical protein